MFEYLLFPILPRLAMIHLDTHERSLRFPLTSNPFPLPNLSLFSLHDKEVCKIYSSIRDMATIPLDPTVTQQPRYESEEEQEDSESRQRQ